ncbi:MAG: DUF4837 family protein [Candidatus Cryptobacteroides sp.]
MRKRILIQIAAAAVALTGCKSNGTMLPNVSGQAGEIIVAMDRNEWEGVLGSTTRELLAAEYPCLPQVEPMFSLSSVPATGFADLFKMHRNILFFNLSSTDKSGVIYRNDVWAHPQCVIQVTAPDSDSAATILRENSERIINTFEQAERDRIIANAKLYEEHSIPPVVKKMTGGSPHFPSGYKLRKATDDFIWIADDKQFSTQGVLIYKYPAAEKENFTEENIIAHRNEFMKNNVPGMFDNTYMITSEMLKPQVSFIRYRGRQFAETRGLWEVYGDFMGGPFVSHSFYSRDGKDIIVLDGFVYAPKYDKRKFLRQVEAILYSFEWDTPEEEEK